MVVGAALAAVGAYVYQVVGARSLGDVGYAPIGALWTIQYLVVSIVLFPVETLVTQRTLVESNRASSDRWLLKVWIWVASSAIVLGVVSWLLREPLFGGLDGLVFVPPLLTLSFAAFLIVRGRLAGLERFKAYGFVTASESGSRAVLAIVVAAIAATTSAFAWIMPFGAALASALWFPLRRKPRERRALGAPVAPAYPLRFLAVTTSANGALQLLLAGGPLALILLGAAPQEVSILFVTLAAARVPLVFFFSGILSRLLPTFLRSAANEPAGLSRTAMLIAAGTIAVALVGGILASVWGAPLIELLFGPDFAPEPWVAAGVTIGVFLATGSTVISQVLIAQRSEVRSLVAWSLGLAAAAIAIAIAGGSPTERVVVAFIVGEALALTTLTAFACRRPDEPSVNALSDRPAGA